MRQHALLLAIGLAATGLATAAIAQPAPDAGPPPGYGAPPPGGGAPGGPMSGPPGQAPHHMNLRAHFDMANTTHDGRLTREQAQAASWRPVAKHFAEIDSDNKGYVTVQDIHAWMKSRHAARMGAAQGAPGAMQGPPPQGAMQGPPPGAPSGQPY